MSQNPYRSPSPSPHAVGVLSGTREDLRLVAVFQKGILICILFQLIAMAVQFAVPPELRVLVLLAVMVLGIASTVFVFLLATKIYPVGIGILLGILTLVPCIGLITLLVVNQKATGILQQNGLKVGLLGVNISSIG